MTTAKEKTAEDPDLSDPYLWVEYFEDLRDHPGLLPAFYQLTQAVYNGFSLQAWHDGGFRDGSYVEHCFVEQGGPMVANVSTTKIELLVDKRPHLAYQVGTVATLPEYRGQGLCRHLLERIMEKRGDRPVFLFANESVLDLYPKFGLYPGPGQSTPFSRAKPGRRVEWASVTLEDPDVARLVRERTVFSPSFDAHAPAITLHHLQTLKDLLYLSPDRQTLLVAECRGAVMDVFGMFSSKESDPEWLLEQLSWPGAERVRYHFEPDGFGLPIEREAALDADLFITPDFPCPTGEWTYPALAIS